MHDIMLFDVAVSNPPYQDTRVGMNSRPQPMYPQFIDHASYIAVDYTIICPARWLFNIGQTHKSWNQKMLNTANLAVTLYTERAESVFPQTEIKGGICIIEYKVVQEKVGLHGRFIARPQQQSILEKVEALQEPSLAEIVSKNAVYKFKQAFNGERKIVSNSFVQHAHMFHETKQSDRHVKILGIRNLQREYRWIDTALIDAPESLYQYKVVLPAANGSGALGERLSSPLVMEPCTGTTESFIYLGGFATRSEAENCLKYVKTKFARTLLSMKKITQSLAKDVWEYVPLQDFTDTSDIEWDGSVQDIDEQLYDKYGLSEAERNFIEETCLTME